MHVYIDKIGEHVGETVTIKGWLHNRRSSGKIHFLVVRDGTGFLQVVMGKNDVDEETFQARRSPGQESAIIVTGTVRADERAQGRLRADRQRRSRSSTQAHDYPDHAEGTRRRLPDGPPAPVDSRRAPDRDPARAPRDHQRRPRLLQRPGLHPRRHADLHAGGVRGHDHAVPGAVLRRQHGLPDAERSALQRSQRDGARQGLRVRSDVPRREEQDAPPPHRVLDGRAGDGLRRSQRRHRAGRGADHVGRRRACSIAGRRN